MKTLFEHVFNLEPTKENIERIKKFQDTFCDEYYNDNYNCCCFEDYMRDGLDEYCDAHDFICAGHICDECPFHVANMADEWVIDYFKDNNNNFLTVRGNILIENK